MNSVPSTNRRQAKNKSQGFTLIELLVVIAIICLLAAILFPVFTRVREKAHAASCVSNMKQIGLGITQYCQDYDERIPNTSSASHPWDDILTPYTGVKAGSTVMTSIFQCPDDITPRIGNFAGLKPRSYAFPKPANGSGGIILSSGVGRLLSEIPLPTSTLMLVEQPVDGNVFGGTSRATCDNPSFELTMSSNSVTEANLTTPTHDDGFNYLFCDGHVKWMHPSATMGPAGVATANPLGMWTIATND